MLFIKVGCYFYTVKGGDGNQYTSGKGGMVINVF
jgi:hypothetical protein